MQFADVPGPVVAQQDVPGARRQAWWAETGFTQEARGQIDDQTGEIVESRP